MLHNLFVLLAGFALSLLCSVLEVVYVCDTYIFFFVLLNIYFSYRFNKETVMWILRGETISLTHLVLYTLLTFAVNYIAFYLLFEFRWLAASSSDTRLAVPLALEEQEQQLVSSEAQSQRVPTPASCCRKAYRIGCDILKLLLHSIQCVSTHLSSGLVGFYMQGSVTPNMRLIYYVPTLAQLPSLCYVVGFLLCRLPAIVRFLASGLLSVVYGVRNFGVQPFLSHHWHRLNIPSLLRLFWLTKCFTCLVSYYFTTVSLRTSYPQSERFSGLMNGSSFADNATGSWQVAYIALREAVMVEGSDNLFSLAGLTSAVSLAAKYISILIAWAIGLRDQDSERAHFGSISAVLFFLLALQSGITALTPDQRVNRLYRNFCILAVGFLHFAENLANSILTHISAGREMRWSAHFRPLFSCACLTVISALFVRYLWWDNAWDPWLLLITSLCFEVSWTSVFFIQGEIASSVKHVECRTAIAIHPNIQ